MYAGLVPVPAETNGDFYMESTLTYLFSGIIGRDKLSMRDKRFIMLGVIAGQGEPAAFEIHARAAVASGDLTTDDLYEFILMALPYAGHPRTTPLKLIVDKIITENKGK